MSYILKVLNDLIWHVDFEDTAVCVYVVVCSSVYECSI
jgi:hypothetical protein